MQLVSIDHGIHLAYNYTNLVEVIRNYGISLAWDASDKLDCNKNKPGVQKTSSECLPKKIIFNWKDSGAN